MTGVPRCVCATLLALLISSTPTIATAQVLPDGQDRRTVQATRLHPNETIVLDGTLDETVWRRAEAARDFVQIDPQNGEPATEPTEVRLAFDSENLYLGVTAFDSEPDKWLGYQRRRDEFLNADDRFQLTIDTFLDGRSGYFFEMNPSGLMADSIFGINGDNRQWDGIWNGRVRKSEIGWTIEIVIPFRTVNFNPNSDTWGINFQRTVRRKNEDSIWMGWARNQGLRRMTNAGRVTGITEVSQGHGLDIKPYALAAAEAAPARGLPKLDGNGTVGVDLFYNPTPLLRTNLTVNTDFAQTEVDQRQVNLTRFSLFFPEKRDFFLDGAPFFDFGSPTSGDLLINPFFSRRIGLSADASPQKIDFGTKLTGQLGANDIGLLHVETGEDDDDRLVGERFTAARLKRRLLNQSYVGAMYTRREARLSDAEARHTVGVDMRLATNAFLGSQNLSFTAWALHASRPDRHSGNNAFGAIVDYPNDRWSVRFDAREVQENFDPAIGFVTRGNYRRYQPTLTFAPRPRNSRRIRQFGYSGTFDVQTDLNNQTLVRSADIQAFGVTLQTQDNFNVGPIFRYERLDRPFMISRGITLPMGATYAFTRFRGVWQTAQRRKVGFGGRVEGGQFFSGTRQEVVFNTNLRLAPGYIVYTTLEFNQIRLKEGHFNTRLVRLVGETQFTPLVTLVNNVQYDTVSRLIGWQSRFRWIVQPGSDIYLVYTHNWLDDVIADRFTTQDRRAATKVLYTYRF